MRGTECLVAPGYAAAVAKLSQSGGKLVLSLSPIEKIAARHGDVRVPLVESVRSGLWSRGSGCVAYGPGTAVPWLVAYGPFAGTATRTSPRSGRAEALEVQLARVSGSRACWCRFAVLVPRNGRFGARGRLRGGGRSLD